MLRKERIVVLNKDDLVPEKTPTEWIDYFKRKGETVTRVSALTGSGIDELRDLIAEKKSSRILKGCAN